MQLSDLWKPFDIGERVVRPVNVHSPKRYHLTYFFRPLASLLFLFSILLDQLRSPTLSDSFYVLFSNIYSSFQWTCFIAGSIRPDHLMSSSMPHYMSRDGWK